MSGPKRSLRASYTARVDAGEITGRFPANVSHDGSVEVVRAFPEHAARFFYTAKADADDRAGSAHPTIKPVDLMQWLARLVTPPGGLILDPFAGSGTTGEAAIREGFDAVLIERDPESVVDIRRRMDVAEGRISRREAKRARVKPAKARGDDLPLFGTDAPAAPPEDDDSELPGFM